MNKEHKIIQGGIVAPQGFKTAGVACGIKKKKGRNDLALIVSEVEASAAGVFTTNLVKAACVVTSQENIKDGKARAVVVNAGNANACNGEKGLVDAKRMMELTAKAVGVPAAQVLNASTGVIGHPLPMEKVEAGIKAAAAKLHGEDGTDTAQAIMTTDTFQKEMAIQFDIDGTPVRLGAIAKGSGMIEPNMATMLAFITTDAVIASPVLQKMLKKVTKTTFNAITVDGDTSTNDMCLALANGLAKNRPVTDLESKGAKQFQEALHSVCLFLAKEIARDGEGATKLVEVMVRQMAEPEKIAKTVGNSPLVKTALFGNDPNWGRILAAAGRSGVAFDPEKVEISLAGVTVYKNGAPTAFDAKQVSAKMKTKEVQIVIDGHQAGQPTATVWTCDFSYDYVKINADYHT
ncbi:MAG: bifunctional glutamate N-acetyltransferase/amino-acid acetyltransferase ArgJ [Alphaproteobacteria bacterium]|nr:bifunctional glutamate N-acetyltransferase/amino-acid acetyltransferase ArgJ [Alphaproteobacteria bacterium]